MFMKMIKKDNTYCCVPQCCTRGSRNPELSFHRFPSVPPKATFNRESREAYENKRKQDWIRLLGIEKEVTSRMRVCSKHFTENDYTYPSHNSLRPRLRPFAIPSLNLPVADNSRKCQTDTERHACNKVSNRSVPHSQKTSHKSPRRTKPLKREFDPIKASDKDLKSTTIELWHKYEESKKNIECLQKEGYKEDDLKWYTDTLEEHQYIKDLANRIMEKLADIENTTVTKVQEELDMR